MKPSTSARGKQGCGTLGFRASWQRSLVRARSSRGCPARCCCLRRQPGRDWWSCSCHWKFPQAWSLNSKSSITFPGELFSSFSSSSTSSLAALSKSLKTILCQQQPVFFPKKGLKQWHMQLSVSSASKKWTFPTNSIQSEIPIPSSESPSWPLSS